MIVGDDQPVIVELARADSALITLPGRMYEKFERIQRFIVYWDASDKCTPKMGRSYCPEKYLEFFWSYKCFIKNGIW